MNVVVTLLARDNVDVTAAWVEYYLAQGVHAIIVTDNGSDDGTLEVLQEYERAGALTLLLEPGDDYRQSEWVTRMARLAATDFDADWVLNVDADEFWRSPEPGKTLVQVLEELPQSASGLLAVRHDLRGKGGRSGGWLTRLRWLDRQTVSERGTPLGLKMAHRASPSITVEMGNHTAGGVAGDVLPPGPIEVVHVPLRSWEQFSRKIRVGGAAVERNETFEPTTAWHWRVDYERLLNGTLEQEYWGRSPSKADLADRERFVRERRLRSELRALRKNAVLPKRLNESLHS